MKTENKEEKKQDEKEDKAAWYFFRRNDRQVIWLVMAFMLAGSAALIFLAMQTSGTYINSSGSDRSFANVAKGFFKPVFRIMEITGDADSAGKNENAGTPKADGEEERERPLLAQAGKRTDYNSAAYDSLSSSYKKGGDYDSQGNKGYEEEDGSGEWDKYNNDYGSYGSSDDEFGSSGTNWTNPNYLSNGSGLIYNGTANSYTEENAASSYGDSGQNKINTGKESIADKSHGAKAINSLQRIKDILMKGINSGSAATAVASGKAAYGQLPGTKNGGKSDKTATGGGNWKNTKSSLSAFSGNSVSAKSLSSSGGSSGESGSSGGGSSSSLSSDSSDSASSASGSSQKSDENKSNIAELLNASSANTKTISKDTCSSTMKSKCTENTCPFTVEAKAGKKITVDYIDSGNVIVKSLDEKNDEGVYLAQYNGTVTYNGYSAKYITSFMYNCSLNSAGKCACSDRKLLAYNVDATQEDIDNAVGEDSTIKTMSAQAENTLSVEQIQQIFTDTNSSLADAAKKCNSVNEDEINKKLKGQVSEDSDCKRVFKGLYISRADQAKINQTNALEALSGNKDEYSSKYTILKSGAGSPIKIQKNVKIGSEEIDIDKILDEIFNGTLLTK